MYYYRFQINWVFLTKKIVFYLHAIGALLFPELDAIELCNNVNIVTLAVSSIWSVSELYGQFQNDPSSVDYDGDLEFVSS
jgi:hypothetical protein